MAKNKIGLFTLLVLFGTYTSAQNAAERTKQKAKDKVNQRTETKTDDAIDKGLDGIENGIKGLFKKKKKKTDSTETKKEAVIEPAVSAEKNNNTPGTTVSTENKVGFKSYSKFDFIAGEKVLYFENFERLDVGDFPAEFNTNASGEVVKIEGKTDKWLNLTKNGAFIPEKINNLPENFTLEFEVGIDGDPTNNYSGFGLNFTTIAEDLMKDMFFSKGTSVVYLHPGAAQAFVEIYPVNGTDISNEIAMPQWNVEANKFAKVSIWRQKGRLRLYVNENKLLDLPRFFSENKPYSFSFFRRYFNDCNQFLGNIKYAIGLPDTRNKLITDGKFVTTGILFDINKAIVKQESYGVIKEIATVLKENPGVKVKVIGHTSSDGDANANLILSKQRALAVKDILMKEFGIEDNRLETDGKGAAEPIDKTNTPTGKANNRRVEFITIK
jgi:OmpA-OmpF porin, OOP family